MKMKKHVIALGAALILGLTGCGGQTQINVEQAGMLASAATGSDKFAGMVVSENVVEIERDTEKQIDELEAQRDEIANRVKQHLGEAGKGDDGNGYVDDRYGFNFVKSRVSEGKPTTGDALNWTKGSGNGTHVAGIAAGNGRASDGK